MALHLPDELPAAARAQAGVVARWQALDDGWTSAEVGHRVTSGRWRVLHPGVYATFSGPLPWRSRAWAALLHAGPGAVLSHEAAGFEQQLVDAAPDRVDVTVAASHRVTQQPGVRLHRSRRHDARRHPARSLPQTRLEDTVLDLAEQCSREDDVVGWLARACQRRLTSPRRIRQALAHRARHRHRHLVHAVLDEVASGVASPLERRYARSVEAAHGLPRSTRNGLVVLSGVRWYRDVRYRRQRTTVELESLAYHPDDEAARDDARDNAAVIAGDAVLRYGWAAVVGSPCTVATEVAAVLRARGWNGQPRPCSPSCPISPEAS
jgi:hypothetical protein